MISRCRSASTFGGVRRGFSLAELLVVIGIIALVLAMVVPTFSRSPALAKRAVCAANLRNLAVGFASVLAERQIRSDKIQGTAGASWTGTIFPYISYSNKALICPEADPHTEVARIRFTERYWSSQDWDFFGMDQSLPPFEGQPAPWNTADYVTYYDSGTVPTMWKLNEEDYVIWRANSDVGHNGMGRNKHLLPRYTPGENPNRYWILFEDQGGVWSSAEAFGHDYNDYAVHVTEQAVNTYTMSFYEFGSSDANNGIVADTGLDMWLQEGSGDKAGVGPFYFSDQATNYGKNRYDPPRGVHQILLLDYELLVCDPDAEGDSEEAFEKNVAPRHLGKCNVLYADQSVQVQSPEDITPRDTAKYELYWKHTP